MALGGEAKEVLRQDQDVGQHAGPRLAFDFFLETGVSAVASVGAEGGFDAAALRG